MNNRVIVAVLWSFSVASAGNAEEASELTLFKPPVALELAPPTYPRAHQQSGKEGWVSVNFMVDPQGKTYDVTVTQSSGDRQFEKAAIKAAEQFSYTPASLDGKAIDAGRSLNITFQLSGATGARRSFAKKYRRYAKRLADGDDEKASKELEAMASLSRNLYEEAYFHMANYLWAVKHGDAAAQYNALSRALFFDGDRGFLPSDAIVRTLLAALNLELRLSLLEKAKQTIERLRQFELSVEQLEMLSNVGAEIDNLETAEGVIHVRARIAHHYTFSHQLLRRSFTVDDVDGRIAEIHLHCDRGYVGFPFEPDLVFDVSASHDACVASFIGDPDTTFTLVELP